MACRSLRSAVLAFALAGTTACTHIGTGPTKAQVFDPAACAGTFEIYFKPEQVQLSAQAKAQIKAAQRAMAGCKIEQISVLGLPDATDDAHAAQKISEARAEAVIATLGGAGIPRDKMRAMASGVVAARPGGSDAMLMRRALITVQASAS